MAYSAYIRSAKLRLQLPPRRVPRAEKPLVSEHEPGSQPGAANQVACRRFPQRRPAPGCSRQPQGARRHIITDRELGRHGRGSGGSEGEPDRPSRRAGKRWRCASDEAPGPARAGPHDESGPARYRRGHGTDRARRRPATSAAAAPGRASASDPAVTRRRRSGTPAGTWSTRPGDCAQAA